jgi:hypothetical protein
MMNEPIIVMPMTTITEVDVNELDTNTINAMMHYIRLGHDRIIEYNGISYALITSGGSLRYDVSYEIKNSIDGTSIIAYRFDVPTIIDTVRFRLFELSSPDGVRIVNLDRERLDGAIYDGFVYVVVHNGIPVYMSTTANIRGLERITKNGVFSVSVENAEVKHYVEINRLVISAEVKEQSSNINLRNSAILITDTGELYVYLRRTTVETGERYEFTLSLENDVLWAEASRYR